MVHDMLKELQGIDPNHLAAIVRQDQGSPQFEIGDWVVERLSTKGIANPDGLFRFRGQGYEGQAAKPWAVVLKIIDGSYEAEDPRDIWYWKRELLVAQSGLLQHLPSPVVAPRVYATVEHENSAWLWMEYISDSTSEPWTPSQYAFVARELGRFNGAYLGGAPLPDYPWLATEHCRWWLATLQRRQPEQAWDNRFVRRAVARRLRPQVARVGAEKERWLGVLDQVPQVFSHFDFQRRNLFIRAREDGTDEVVAVDWGWVGRGPLGGDLFSLVGGSAILFEVELEGLPELEASAFEAYLAGLNDAGWNGDPDLVRLAYTTWFALWIGAVGPAATAVWTSDERIEAALQQFGRGPEEIAAAWALLCELGLERADEARRLRDQLQVG